MCLFSVPLEQRRRVPTCRRPSVRLCPRRPVDGHVPLQVQADEADQDVQGSQTRHLLQIQHSEFAIFQVFDCGSSP